MPGNTNYQQTPATQTTYYSIGSATGGSEAYTPTFPQGAQHTAAPSLTPPMERWMNESFREGHWNSEGSLASGCSSWSGKRGGNNL
ncbi:hypothetical protein GP486_002659 [Trichoglossum hirsutum]|uniref:Uncharacterized protein n=1 Tax=Trichoglossum hirsutum TaxID=265104 RepID=A0A9P8RRW9_9PEZI|nr:hypothetical protein GP486_002659 [Trichoglossum hirsutum]